MDADGDNQDYGAVQVDIYGRPGNLPCSWCRSPAQLTTGAEVSVVETLYSAGGGIDGRCIWGQQGATPVKTFWLDGHLNLPSLLREFSTNVYYAVSRWSAQYLSVANKGVHFASL